MKRLLLAALLFLASISIARAQQTPTDAPASKEDIERYLEVTHSRDMMKQMMDVMAKQIHQMVHQQISRNGEKLPPDFETKMTKMTDDMLKDLPLEEMLQAMIPIYQKHWTKGDVDSLVAFYSTPTGQKILKDMPATMAEAMQAITPLMQKQMARVMEKVDLEIAETAKESKNKSGPKNQPVSN